jgi:hypothetical protein
VHDPSEVLTSCTGPGKPGCCLSPGAWSEDHSAFLAAAMPCENGGKGGRMQLWSRSGGSLTSEDGPQLCLDGANLCLTHKPGEPVLVRGREPSYQPGQNWRVTGHSIDFPGELLSTTQGVNHDACAAACNSDSDCKAFHYDAESKTCQLRGESVCLMAVPP